MRRFRVTRTEIEADQRGEPDLVQYALKKDRMTWSADEDAADLYETEDRYEAIREAAGWPDAFVTQIVEEPEVVTETHQGGEG